MLNFIYIFQHIVEKYLACGLHYTWLSYFSPDYPVINTVCSVQRFLPQFMTLLIKNMTVRLPPKCTMSEKWKKHQLVKFIWLRNKKKTGAAPLKNNSKRELECFLNITSAFFQTGFENYLFPTCCLRNMNRTELFYCYGCSNNTQLTHVSTIKHQL